MNPFAIKIGTQPSSLGITCCVSENTKIIDAEINFAIYERQEKVLEQNPGKVKNPDDLIDKYLSGIYLITALKHMIAWNSGKPVYTMLAEVTKDALGDVPSFGGKK